MRVCPFLLSLYREVWITKKQIKKNEYKKKKSMHMSAWKSNLPSIFFILKNFFPYVNFRLSSSDSHIKWILNWCRYLFIACYIHTLIMTATFNMTCKFSSWWKKMYFNNIKIQLEILVEIIIHSAHKAINSFFSPHPYLCISLDDMCNVWVS